MRRLSIILFTTLAQFCLGLGSLCADDKAAQPQDNDKIAKPTTSRQAAAIVDLLASPNPDKRAQAAETLLLHGERFLPSLQETLRKMTDDEARCRLQVVVAELEQRRMTQPRRVTLKAENKKLSSIFSELQRQSGYKIQFPEQPGEETRYNLKLENAPFWEAVDKAAELGGGKVQLLNFPNQLDSQLSYQASDSHDPHVAYSGPCRLEATYLHANKNLMLGRLPKGKRPVRRPENINLQMQLTVEPKSPILGGWIATETTKAIDEFGESMRHPMYEPEFDEMTYETSGVRKAHASSLNVSLLRPSADTTMIKELRVRAKVPMTAGTREVLTVTDPLNAVGKRIQTRDFDFIIDSAKYEGGVLTMEITAIRKRGEAARFNLAYATSSLLEIYDAKDRLYSMTQNLEGRIGINIATMTLTFAGDQFQNDNVKLGKPKKLCISEHIIVRKEFEFVFKNIPIP